MTTVWSPEAPASWCCHVAGSSHTSVDTRCGTKLCPGHRAAHTRERRVEAMLQNVEDARIPRSYTEPRYRRPRTRGSPRPRPSKQFAPRHCAAFPVLAHVSPPTISKSPLEEPSRVVGGARRHNMVAQRRLIRVHRQLGFTLLDVRHTDTQPGGAGGKERRVAVAELHCRTVRLAGAGDADGHRRALAV